MGNTLSSWRRRTARALNRGNAAGASRDVMITHVVNLTAALDLAPLKVKVKLKTPPTLPQEKKDDDNPLPVPPPAPRRRSGRLGLNPRGPPMPRRPRRRSVLDLVRVFERARREQVQAAEPPVPAAFAEEELEEPDEVINNRRESLRRVEQPEPATQVEIDTEEGERNLEGMDVREVAENAGDLDDAPVEGATGENALTVNEGLEDFENIGIVDELDQNEADADSNIVSELGAENTETNIAADNSRAPGGLSAWGKDGRKVLAAALIQKLKKTHKTIDLFPFSTKSPGRRNSTRSLLDYALDCDEAVASLAEALEKARDAVRSGKDKSQKRSTVMGGSTGGPTLHSVLSPGIEMSGSIDIPPHLDTEAESHEYTNLDPQFNNTKQDVLRPYELQILRQGVDELGNTFWIGRHQTFYGRRDKQTIVWFCKSPTEFYFEDFETLCTGQQDDMRRSLSSNSRHAFEFAADDSSSDGYDDEEGDEFRFRGDVEQLKLGQPGYLLHRDTRKHFFRLRLSKDSWSKNVNKIRSMYLKARMARSMAFAAWAGSQRKRKCDRETFGGRSINWADIVEDMVWILDEVGTMMRRYVLLLGDLKFENKKQRTAMLETLASKGISRFHIHESWDAATLLLGKLREVRPTGSVHTRNDMKRADNFADKVISRLDLIYTRFDKSLRKADVRVCLSHLREWEARCKDSSESVVCAICADAFSFGETFYNTPCDHQFHKDCLDSWFKQSSVCPVCRQDYSEAD